MQNLKESVAYLQGLIEGVNIDISSKEGRVISGMLDTMGGMLDVMESIQAKQSELEMYLDSIDEELMEIEDDIYQMDDEFVEIECPECHDIVLFDSEILEDEDTIEVTCPNCDTVVFVNSGEYNASQANNIQGGCKPGRERDMIQ